MLHILHNSPSNIPGHKYSGLDYSNLSKLEASRSRTIGDNMVVFTSSDKWTLLSLFQIVNACTTCISIVLKNDLSDKP